jgi:mono/diheme cytochrome c family protein
VQAKASQRGEGNDAGALAGTPEPFERIQNLYPNKSTRFDLKTSRLAIAVSSLFFVLTAVFAQTPPSDSNLTANAVYQKNCAKCHGKTAEGRHFAGPSLISEKTAATSADDLRNIITNGKGRMPKNAGKLTSAEIDTLVQQIKTSKSKP